MSRPRQDTRGYVKAFSFSCSQKDVELWGAIHQALADKAGNPELPKSEAFRTSLLSLAESHGLLDKRTGELKKSAKLFSAKKVAKKARAKRSESTKKAVKGKPGAKRKAKKAKAVEKSANDA